MDYVTVSKCYILDIISDTLVKTNNAYLFKETD